MLFTRSCRSATVSGRPTLVAPDFTCPRSMVDAATLPSGGSLDITRHELHVEMQLSSPKLAKPRLYAFALTDQLAAFFSELAKDLGDPDMVVEMQSASGAAVSPLMVHSFAWKAGRSIIAGGSRIDVAISSEEGAVNAGEGCPSPRRRQSMRPVMKYVIVSGGVVSGLGKGVTASSLGVLLKVTRRPHTRPRSQPHPHTCPDPHPFTRTLTLTLTCWPGPSPDLAHGPDPGHEPDPRARPAPEHSPCPAPDAGPDALLARPRATA